MLTFTAASHQGATDVFRSHFLGGCHLYTQSVSHTVNKQYSFTCLGFWGGPHFSRGAHATPALSFGHVPATCHLLPADPSWSHLPELHLVLFVLFVEDDLASVFSARENETMNSHYYSIKTHRCRKSHCDSVYTVILWLQQCLPCLYLCVIVCSSVCVCACVSSVSLSLCLGFAPRWSKLHKIDVWPRCILLNLWKSEKEGTCKCKVRMEKGRTGGLACGRGLWRG